MNSFLREMLLSAFPRRTYTAFIGKLVRTRFSARLIPWYVKKFNIDVAELDGEMSEYQTLGQFFSRKLTSSSRPVCGQITSPVDGTVSTCGTIVNDTLLQIKGLTYSFRALLGNGETAQFYQGGTYLTFYLSPRDYHRIHAPLDCTAVRYQHIPGTLFPVNRYGVTHVDGLFVRNERTVTEFEALRFHFAMAKVGAAGVGTVVTPYVPRRSHWHRGHGSVLQGTCDKSFQRGEEIGYFALGSTVVLVFSPEVKIVLQVKSGQKVKMGQEIAQFAE